MDSETKKLEERQLCFHCNFWIEKVAIKDRPRVVRIDGSHYQIGKEDKISWAEFRGFGGSKFVIVFNDGRRVETTQPLASGNHTGVLQGETPRQCEVRTAHQKFDELSQL